MAGTSFTLAVASGKGGTGKTLIATNIAAIEARKASVALADCDVEAPDAGLFFETETIELPTSKTDPSTLQYLHFLDAVQGRKPAFPSARDHLPAVLIARAAQMSQAEQRHIKASEVT